MRTDQVFANLGRSGSKNNGNERVLHIPRSCRTRISPSDGIVSYSGYSLEENPSVEMQSEYSSATADEADELCHVMAHRDEEWE